MDKKSLSVNLYEFLESGVRQLGFNFPKTTIEQFLDYVFLLIKWNNIHNLTAITDPKAIIIRHIFDSLAIAPFILGPDILDFGSGAGVPGLILAIALPDYNFVLLDSSKKKTLFLNHVVLTLKIKNIQVIHNRIEEFQFSPLFATIVTRATAKTDLVIEKTSRLCKKNGQILIMKGKEPKEELKLIKKPFELIPIQVPYLNEERHLIKVTN